MSAPGQRTVPSRTDPTAARASGVLGGPIGRYAATPSMRWWTPLRVLMLFTGLTLLLAYAQKSPCADGQWAHNSQYTQVCYSDVIPLWGAERLDVGAVPYRDHAVEYPVLTGAFMGATAAVTRAISGPLGAGDLGVLFGAVTCVGLALFGFAVTGFTAGAAGTRRRWDAALFALSPLLVFHAFSNWDLIAMAFTSAALWAWARRWPVAAGVLIGLGTAAKLYPVFLLVALGILAVRTRTYRPVVYATVAAGLSWVAVNLPVAAAFYPGWREFYSFSAGRTAEASTFWAMAHYLTTVGLGGGTADGWTPPGIDVAALLLVALLGVTALGLSAPRRPRLAQLTLLAVVAFLLTTKVWSPQYSLWLVPLVALARPRWRLSLIWQGSEIVVWILTLLWLAGFSDPNRGLDYGWLMLALLIRDALLVTICALVVREMWRPELDVVRAAGLDDPGGGPFDGVADHFSAQARAERRRLREQDLSELDGSPSQTP